MRRGLSSIQQLGVVLALFLAGAFITWYSLGFAPFNPNDFASLTGPTTCVFGQRGVYYNSSNGTYAYGPSSCGPLLPVLFGGTVGAFTGWIVSGVRPSRRLR